MDAVSVKENLSDRPEDVVAFRIDDRPVSVADVIDAAAFRNALRSTWLDLARKLDREKIAVGLDPDDDEKLQALADQFRYDRDLISAEETETWFAKRGVTMEEFHDYLTRNIRDEQLASHEAPDPVELAFAPSEQRDLLRVELLISGEFDQLAIALSWRMVASRGPGDEANGSSEAEEMERNRFAERTGMEFAAIGIWLEALGRNEAWFQEQLRMETAYRAHCERALTPERRARTLNSLRLPLTFLEVETVEFDREEALNEAYLCVHEDGLSMADLAEQGRFPYSKKEFLVEDLPEYWQRRFLAASEGATLEPQADDGGFQLCHLLRKQEPNLENASVSSRIDKRILESHFAELSGQRVRWLLS